MDPWEQGHDNFSDSAALQGEPQPWAQNKL